MKIFSFGLKCILEKIRLLFILLHSIKFLAETNQLTKIINFHKILPLGKI